VRGRSGSGKTTLLNVIGGLDVPTGGTVHVAGVADHPLIARARRLPARAMYQAGRGRPPSRRRHAAGE